MSLATAVKTSQKFDSVLDCPRCSGQGYIQAYSHIKGGVCFLCGGTKVIESNCRYTKKEKLVCIFTKGHCNMYDDNYKLIWQYREAIRVSFNGGDSFEFARLIDDSNRQSMRNIWKWCKANGADMIIEDDDKA